jgi:hypothetical protein
MNAGEPGIIEKILSFRVVIFPAALRYRDMAASTTVPVVSRPSPWRTSKEIGARSTATTSPTSFAMSQAVLPVSRSTRQLPCRMFPGVSPMMPTVKPETSTLSICPWSM